MPDSKQPTRLSRSPAYYSVIGGLVALALEGVPTAISFLGKRIPSQLDVIFLLPLAVWVLVLVCRCAVSFWIGYKAPEWWWGLSPVIAKLIVLAGWLVMFGPPHRATAPSTRASCG
jgi:hypothetical protein